MWPTLAEFGPKLGEHGPTVAEDGRARPEAGVELGPNLVEYGPILTSAQAWSNSAPTFCRCRSTLVEIGPKKVDLGELGAIWLCSATCVRH